MVGDAKVSQNTWVPMAGDAKVSQNTWVPMAGDVKVSQNKGLEGEVWASKFQVLGGHPKSVPDGPFQSKFNLFWALRGVPPRTDLSGRESVAKHMGPYGWEVLLAIYVIRGCFWELQKAILSIFASFAACFA
jgi:hypothetical protein